MTLSSCSASVLISPGVHDVCGMSWSYGVVALQALCKDSRMLPAGGAPEIELCQQLQKYGRKETGLDQYAIAKFAESLEVRSTVVHVYLTVRCTQDSA